MAGWPKEQSFRVSHYHSAVTGRIPDMCACDSVDPSPMNDPNMAFSVFRFSVTLYNGAVLGKKACMHQQKKWYLEIFLLLILYITYLNKSPKHLHYAHSLPCSNQSAHNLKLNFHCRHIYHGPAKPHPFQHQTAQSAER